MAEVLYPAGGEVLAEARCFIFDATGKSRAVAMDTIKVIVQGLNALL